VTRLRSIRKAEGTSLAPRGVAFRPRPASRRGRRIPRQTATFTIAKDLDRKMGRATLQALKLMRGRVSLAEIAALVPTASPDEIYRVASAGGAQAMTVQLQPLTMDGIQRSGDAAGRQVPGPNAVIDLGRPAVAAWVKDHAAEFLTNVNATQGRHPMRMAKDIKGAVGLNKPQAQALINRRKTLEAAGMRADLVEKKVAKYEAKLLRQRAQTIARTESMKAVNTGRRLLWEQLKEDGALPANVEQQWLTGDDERTCIYCSPLHLTRQPLGNTWSSGPYTVAAPPLHINCLPAGVEIDGPAAVGAMRRHYDGYLIDIETASGARLSVTPNHPVLTSAGWGAAHLLNEGSNVVSRRPGERVTWSSGPSVGLPFWPTTSPDGDNAPALIEQVFEALGLSGSMLTDQVPASDVQFHGDGSTNGDVDVVYPAGLLEHAREAQLGEPLPHEQLRRGCKPLISLEGLGAFDLRGLRFGAASHGFMRSSRNASALLWACLVHAKLLRRSAPPGNNSASQEAGANGRPCASELIRERFLRPPTEIEAADFAIRQIEMGALHWDRVTSVGRRAFSGHVYNLQSVEGWYTGNGIVTSNCRCTLALVEPGEEENLS